jgi:aldose 1-epimerase
MDLVSLRLGEGEAVLAPGIGGGIVSWTHRGRPMLRPALPNALDLQLVRGLGAYPLVPFSNRIDRGVFTFDGLRTELPATAGGHAIHGVGWKRPWHVIERSDHAATIGLDHAPDELWPYAFHAEQQIALGETGLTWAMRVTNRHDDPAPAGLGFHPYFPTGTGVLLRFAAEGVWFGGPDVIPMRHARVPAEWDHTHGRRVGSAVLDNCFTGWRSPALLGYATHSLAITADALFGCLVVFTPEGKDFFAVEPVSHMNDAINRTGDHAMTVLQSGETLAGAMHMEVSHA